MDRPSELMLKARDVHWRVREIAPDVNEWEFKMINDLLDIVLQFPIVKPHEDTTREEVTNH
jgi:hypothetical protein